MMAYAAVRSSETRRWLTCLFVVAAVASLAGCDSKPAKIPSVPALPPNDTPEGKLARVMQRLDSAIVTAQAASGSGVISQRRAFHKLLSPPAGSEFPEAIVFIETKRALAPQALNAAAQAKLQEEAEKQGKDAPDAPAKTLKVDDEQQVEVAEFPLAYDGQRWKLVKELNRNLEDGSPSTEYILFDYALDAN
ncbi:MAG: hypothetical protein JNL18_19510 [Planctomycetaceae bacterium]|nr:hypothetical protein [Planctomycetaceae bacterium]